MKAVFFPLHFGRHKQGIQDLKRSSTSSDPRLGGDHEEGNYPRRTKLAGKYSSGWAARSPRSFGPSLRRLWYLVSFTSHSVSIESRRSSPRGESTQGRNRCGKPSWQAERPSDVQASKVSSKHNGEKLPMTIVAVSVGISAPNPKFAHTVRQMRSRTSGSKGELEYSIELLVVLIFRGSYLNVPRVQTKLESDR